MDMRTASGGPFSRPEWETGCGAVRLPLARGGMGRAAPLKQGELSDERREYD